MTSTASTALQELAAQLRNANRGDIGDTIRKSVQDAAKPVVSNVQQAVRTLRIVGVPPSRRPRRRTARRGPPLRATVAGAVRSTSTQSGVTIYVDESRLPAGWRNLPTYMDSTTGWIHPVFGNRRVWARSRGGPWFGVTIERDSPVFHRGAERGISEAAAELAGKVS